MADQTTRPRRIVRRAVMALAAVVLLVAWYVASAAIFMVAVNAAWLPPSVPKSWAVAYATPLLRYSEHSEWPGAVACQAVMQWAIRTGNRLER